MTVSTPYTPEQYTGTGLETELAVDFVFNESSELVVTSRVTATGVETVLIEDTHYTVAGGSYATGTVTPIDGATDFPSTVTWTISRETPATQETDWVESDEFPSQSHERAADKLTLMAQERDWTAQRGLRFPETDDVALSSELPSSVDRASMSLGFDANGEPVALAGTVSGDVTVTSFMATVLDDGSADTARETLGIQSGLDAAKGAAPTAGTLYLATDTRILYRSDGTNWIPIVIGQYAFASLPAAATAGRVFLDTNRLQLLRDSGAALVEIKAPLPRSYLAGLGLSNDTDTEHDIAIAAGECRDSANGYNLSLSDVLTKRIDAAWAAGDDAGGMFTGSVGNNTWYHVFLILKDSDLSVDAGFDTDVDAANIPSGYTAYRRIGSVRTDGSANIMQFHQFGDEFLWDDADETREIDEGDGGAYDSGTSVDVDLDYVPPDVRVRAILSAEVVANGGNTTVRISSVDQSDSGDPSHTDGACANIAATTTDPGASQIIVRTPPTGTGNAGQIRVSVDQDNVDLSVVTEGYLDRRGRDD